MSPFLDEYKVAGRVDRWEHRRTETGAYFVAVGEEEVGGEENLDDMQRRPPSSSHQTATRSWHSTAWTLPRCYRRLLAMLIVRLSESLASEREKICEFVNLQ